MSHPDEYTVRRYAEAKRTVDARALHRPTLGRLREALAERAEPVRVFEVGCETGATLQRLLSMDVLPDRVVYDGYDLRREAVEAALESVADWAPAQGFSVDTPATEPGDPLHLVDEERGKQVTATFSAADGLAVAEATDREWDLLVARGLLGMVALSEGLPTLLDCVPDGLAYFPLTYDGETFFRPTPNPDREQAVLDAYHAGRNEPGRPGGTHTGRALFTALPGSGADVLAAGGAARLVTPPYPADEAYMLHHRIDDIAAGARESLSPTLGGTAPADRLDATAIEEWAADRHEAVADERLTYGTHNIDVLARVQR
ncbi:class I SAM-dependent methyltransferase [Halorubrum gandharaense]